jgi:hypothetical protein
MVSSSRATSDGSWVTAGHGCQREGAPHLVAVDGVAPGLEAKYPVTDYGVAVAGKRSSHTHTLSCPVRIVKPPGRPGT